MKAGLAALAVGLGISVSVVAQQVTPPVFREGVELVAVDVQVLDGKGRHVPELTAADFEVAVDGRPRRVASVSFVTLAAPSANPPTAAQEFRPYGSNETPPGRLVVLAPDAGHLTVAGGRGAMEAARRFLDRLGPADRVALVTLPTGPSLEFTADHARVREALGRVSGSADSGQGWHNVSLSEAMAYVTESDLRVWNLAVNRECSHIIALGREAEAFAHCRGQMEMQAREIGNRWRSTAETTVRRLEALLGALEKIDGPKSLVLVSQGLVTGGSLGRSGTLGDLAPLAEAAARARTTIHAILVDRTFIELFGSEKRTPSQTASEDARLRAEGLERLTDLAGGELYKVMVAADPAFVRIAEDTSAFWLLSFEPEPSDRDGKTHRIRVEVKRDGLHVRARPEFIALPTRAAAGTAAEQAAQALDSAWPATGLPVRVSTYAIGEGESVRVLLSAEIGHAVPAAGEVSLAYRVVDAQGAPAGHSAETVRLEVAGHGEDAARAYSTSFVVKPGPYLLKLAAVDEGRAAGSLEHALQARLLPVGGFLVSDLLVADPARRAGGNLMLTPDGVLRGESLSVYLEVRPAVADASVEAPSVRFELDCPEAGGPLLQEADRRGDAASGWSAEALLSLSGQRGGDCVLHAAVSRAGAEVGRVSRPLRIVRPPSP